MELAVCCGGLDDPPATANLLLENGVQIIETGPDFFLNSDDDKIESTAKSFMAKGISIRSVHAPFGEDCNLSDFDAENREKAIQTHQNLLYKVAPAGVKMIIIHPGGDGLSEEDLENMSSLTSDSISQLIGAVEETGVKLALENMLPGSPGCEIKHILDILEKVNSPSLGVCFDTGHAHICGNMKEFMEAVGEYIISIHMQDNDGVSDLHLQPPYGTTNWQAFAEVLQNINYSDPITIEAMPWGGASFKQMLREVSAVLENAMTPDEWQANNPNLALRCLKCGHAILRSKGQWFCNCTYV